MAEQLSRKELYDLVWSEPMRTLSARFGISDVALKKTCKRAEIPTPDRGYWAKKEARKETFQAALPLRPPGMNDKILVGSGNNYYWYSESREELLAPLPPPPEFPEPLEAVQERIAKKIGLATVPNHIRIWHPAIDRLLKEDQERESASAYAYWQNKPRLDTPIEHRRLRILNSLFFAVQKMNGKPSISFSEELDAGVSFYQHSVHIALNPPKQTHRRSQSGIAQTASSEAKLIFSILQGYRSEETRMTWQDSDEGKLEARMTEIAVQVILTAEILCREEASHRYRLRAEQKAQLEEKEQQQKLAAERAEKERLRQIEQSRIDRLVRDAAALQQANEIRRYVEAIRSSQTSNRAAATDELDRWTQWALEQAGRIDPVHMKCSYQQCTTKTTPSSSPNDIECACLN